MSFWIEREENGRRTLTLANGGDMMLSLFAIGLFALFFITSPWMFWLFFSTGFACFFVAKLSLLRQRIWVSWGTSRMSAGYGRLYRVGYAMMLIGVLWSVLARTANGS